MTISNEVVLNWQKRKAGRAGEPRDGVRRDEAF